MLVKFEVYNDGEYWCARGIGVDIFTHGKTLDELMDNIKEAVEVHFKEMLEIFSAYGIKFNIITNGFNFKEVMSLVLKPHIFRNFAGFCFSIDGPREEIHDAIRGEGSFREIIQACNLCRLNSVNFSIKSLLSNLSKNTQDIDEMIDATEKLVEKGFAYERLRSVYFDISRCKDYGKLSRVDLKKVIKY